MWQHLQWNGRSARGVYSGKDAEKKNTTKKFPYFVVPNSIKFQHNGSIKTVKQKFKAKKKVKVIDGKGESITRLKVRRRYPLRVVTNTKQFQDGTYRLITDLSHTLKEKHVSGCFVKSISNEQNSKGWIEVKGHSVVSGQASTSQNYSYFDRFTCYSRNVAATNGRVVADNSTFVCEL